ncbi:hypothetical protein D7X25_33215, partial [bacterium 1XD42-8]
PLPVCFRQFLNLLIYRLGTMYNPKLSNPEPSENNPLSSSDSENNPLSSSDSENNPLSSSDSENSNVLSSSSAPENGFKEKKIEMITDCKWKKIGNYNLGLVPVQDSEGKYTYLDDRGIVKWDKKFDAARDFSDDGYALVNENGAFRYIDINGNYLKNMKFDNAGGFYNGYAIIRDRGVFKFIDKKGEIVERKEWEDLDYFSENLAAVQIKNLWGFINNNGDLIIDSVWEDVKLKDNKEYNKDYDKDRKWGFSNGLAAVKRNGKWGFINTSGEVVIEYVWDDVYSFNEETAVVKKRKLDKNQYGLIDKKGNLIMEVKYDEIWSCYEGMCKFLLNGEYGFYDVENKKELTSRWFEAKFYSNEYAPVKNADKEWLFIDKEGNENKKLGRWNDAYIFIGGIAVVGEINEGRWVYYLIDLQGQKVYQSKNPIHYAFWFTSKENYYSVEDSISRKYGILKYDS